MDSTKCAQCGLVNYSGSSECRRCGNLVIAPAPVELEGSGRKRLILKSFVRIVALAGFILFMGYATMLSTSDPVVLEQRQIVDRAVDVIEAKGFSKEAFVLRNLVRYRATDSWWNRWVGHENAYASANFPFQIVTLYPPFFEHPIDDTERAAILLHESYHLFGRGERAAFEGVWKERQTLGWTKEKYNGTVVWTIVRDSTAFYAPHLFRCGEDGRSDCTEEQKVAQK